MKAKPTRIDMAGALADLAACEAEPDQVPPGWKTVKQWRAELEAGDCDTGTSRDVVARRLRKLVDEGAWERQKFRVKSGGRVYPVPHYRKRP